MRFTAGSVANAIAWLAIFALAAAAVVAVRAYGFAGLAVLGAATWLVCVLAELDEDAPTWGTHVFRARMEAPPTRPDLVSPFRFYGRCGMLLFAVGALGLAAQLWRG